MEKKIIKIDEKDTLVFEAGKNELRDLTNKLRKVKMIVGGFFGVKWKD